ncbi:hypothetical protein BJX63DRAFT_39666 [Aspergillus granulosus]|uniref:F-box domain-containing protein n=1 Tax=Aspergillus granulosus TaxID=176169 RepID=A0ABR4GYH6_9EURO
MPLHLSIESLPNELKCEIIRYLDPVALISISQTNRHFRGIINPTKTHLTERLLALECLEEFGGPEITYSRHGIASPDHTSPEWKANRWACIDCLRLLPCHSFTNQAVSRLGYRKPIAGSPAVQKCTSWEPTSPTDTRDKPPFSQRYKLDEKEDRILRHRYAIATTHNRGEHLVSNSHSNDAFQLLTARLIKFQDAGLVGFQNMDVHTFASLTEAQESEILDREAQAIELVRAGFNRHHRRCLECRFQRGEFRGCSGAGKGLGTPDVPIVPGRQVWFGSVVDRYFPGVTDVLNAKRPPVNAPLYAIYRETATERPWTLYRVRCAGCERWQELRAFRFGGINPRYQVREVLSSQGHSDSYYNWDEHPVNDNVLNDLRCNQCFVIQHGHKELERILINWLTSLIDAQIVEYAWNLRVGFNYILQHFTFSKKDKASTKPLVWDMKELLTKEALDISRTDVALISQRRMEWLDLYPRLRDGHRKEHGLWFDPDQFFWQWVERYEESKVLWFWLTELRDEIRQAGKGKLLVKWALRRNGTIYS